MQACPIESYLSNKSNKTMNKTLTTKFDVTDKKAAFILTLLVFAFVVMNLTQDFLRASFKKSAFYFSEAFMFSSFWWLFAPLLFIQYLAFKHTNPKNFVLSLLVVTVPIFLHLFAFPFLVLALSTAFYYHTYSFLQTLKYALTEYLYLIMFFYSIPILSFYYFTNRKKSIESVSKTQGDKIPLQFISSFLVFDGNRKSSIKVSEIQYFTANSPYINIHHQDKKYLQNETLKSVSTKLNPEEFVRIHKSTIVNIEMVASYTTRQNGDYDLKMKSNVQLRVSRNFATDFKNSLNKIHRLTTK